MLSSETRIIEFAHLVPGPFATQLLTDLGAEVIKVEPKSGDRARRFPFPEALPAGSVFGTLNQGKRSIAVDLKTDAGQALVQDLVAEADGVVEGYQPGVAERLGIDAETLFAHNDALVYCSVSGFGASGPDHDQPGHGLNYTAASGLLDLTRSGPAERPALLGYPLAGMAGGLYTAFALVAGLAGPDTQRYIDVSMVEAMMSFGWMLAPLARQVPVQVRAGRTFLTGQLPWYNVYRTADDRFLAVAIFEDDLWARFCTAIDRPDLQDLYGTADHAERVALREELASTVQARSRTEWEQLLDGLDVPITVVRTFPEALDQPQLQARDMLVDEATPRMGPPFLVDKDRPGATGEPPAVGADTEPLLRELGLDDERITQLLADAVVSGSTGD